MLQLVELGGGEPVVPLAAVGLGLADPAAQGLLMDAEVLRDVGDRAAGGADLTDRALAQFIRVLTWCWWFSFARTVTLASGTPQISVQLTIERLINKLKAWGGIATRYDKTPKSYQAGLYLRASMIWIKDLTRASQ
ncbi:Transposase, IS4 [Streptomyces microflavus DSM 40593]|uniref:Transposase, IS4 n=1 Tax=Streptomyces microflavus DSM 40593 TaxID=1303692 RepID=N0D5T3_STRMI|nr:Transposase, IS4 [Streptomyces microflavus DSM 40593]